jgi:hypothetical protein
MIRKHAPEEIGFTPEAVFDAGIRSDTWPCVAGLHVLPEQEIISLGGVIRANLQIPVISIGLDCRVTEFEVAERVRIEGSSKVARAMLLFELRESGTDGTRVDYTLEIEPKNLLARAAAPAVKMFAETAVPEFAAGFKSNVISYLTS